MTATRRRLAAALLGFGSILAATPAAEAQTLPKVAVLDVRAVGTFDAKAVQGLASVVAAEAESYPLKVVVSGDIAALVGFDREKRLLGCGENACLAEIGGALGVEYLLSTEVSEVGGVWIVTATLIDVAKARAIKRATRQLDEPRALVPLAREATREALDTIAARRSPLLAASAATPATAPPAEAVRPAPAPKRGSRTLGYVLDAGGAALLAGGAVAGVLALSTYQDAKKAAAPKLDDLRSRGKSQALLADVLFGASAVALGTGLYFTFAGSGESAPKLTGAAGPGAAALALQGGF